MKNNIEISFNYEPKVEIKGDVHKEYLVEFINSQTNIVEHSSKIKNNMWTKCNKRYHIPWTIRINGEIVHKWNLKDKNVLISLDSKSIGDTLAWAPQAVEFAKKYKCKVTLSTFHNEWFKNIPEYKDIKFGDDPSLLKSPFDIVIPLEFDKNIKFNIRVIFENINNNIEWLEMDDKNTVEIK